MKIVCDACGTKYSIGDDRVAGKVFKIRCKKCNQIIVVRGQTVAAVIEAEAASTSEWHLAIDGNQSGPFDRADLMRRHASGELDDESLVWRDGMEEWAAFYSIPELADGTTRTERAPVSGTDQDHDGLFSTTSKPEEVFASEPANEVMFASTAPARSMAAQAAPEDKKLLAERNENSVLFTLGNLAKLASSERPSGKRDAPAAKQGAAGEGSGLIDIRALASTFAKPGTATKLATGVGSLDDLPTFGPTTFGEPIVLMPAARQGVDRKMIYALFAALAMLAIVGAVLLVVVLRDDNDKQASTDTPGPRVAQLGNGDLSGSTASGSTASGSTASGSTASGLTASGSTSAATTAPAAATSATGTTPPNTSTSSTTPATGTTRPNSSTTRPNTSSTATTRPNTSTTRPNSSTTSTGTSSTTRPNTSTTATTRPNTSTTTTTNPNTSTTRPTTVPDRVQCEFSNFADKGCEIYKPAGSTVASNLPDNLDRGAIATGLGMIRAQACGGRSSARGDVSVQIKVNADGGVSGVTVKSSPDPVLSSCVVAAAQKGTFAKTKRGASFGYVWRF